MAGSRRFIGSPGIAVACAGLATAIGGAITIPCTLGGVLPSWLLVVLVAPLWVLALVCVGAVVRIERMHTS